MAEYYVTLIAMGYMNVCIHVNKSSFKPMSVILFICNPLGSLSALWSQIHLPSIPVLNNHHEIVVTFW